MKVSQVFSGKTFVAADFEEEDGTYVIADIEVREFEDGNKLNVTFQHEEKAFVCNKTNSRRIASQYGDETDGWIGKEITLYHEMVDFGGKTVAAIRVRMPKKRPVAAAARVNRIVQDGPLDEEPPLP